MSSFLERACNPLPPLKPLSPFGRIRIVDTDPRDHPVANDGWNRPTLRDPIKQYGVMRDFPFGDQNDSGN